MKAMTLALVLLQAQASLITKCFQESISKGQQEEWASSLGALRLWCCLGQTDAELSSAEVETLTAVRQKALDDNGTEALLLAGQLQKVLQRVVAAS